MKSSKLLVTSALLMSVAFGVAAQDDGLPPKTKPGGDEVDCGAKTETNLDRKLEKNAPELSMSDENSPAGKYKTTVGFTGSTATLGADISDDNLLNLVIGKTKYQDVTALFGKPTATVRTDQIFFVTYNFTKGETKLDPVSFIPVVGSLFAKNKSSYVERKVTLRFGPNDGILISCKKTDNITEPKSESQLDMLKKIKLD